MLTPIITPQEEKYTNYGIRTAHLWGYIRGVWGSGQSYKTLRELGDVIFTKETTGDSFEYIYKLRAENRLYDVIDIDSYGYPSKFFPLIFEMIKDEGLLIFTFQSWAFNV